MLRDQRTMNRVLCGLLWCSFTFSLCGCSGVRQSVPPPTQGNATLSLTLRATKPSPSGHLSILAFRAMVTGVSLTPSSGSPVSVGLVPEPAGATLLNSCACRAIRHSSRLPCRSPQGHITVSPSHSRMFYSVSARSRLRELPAAPG
jgi:hypothetical protein